MSAENTADNPGRIVFVISWFLFCVLWLTVGTRMVTRWTLTRRFEGDDIVTWIALLFGSAQTAAVTVAIYNGLGQSIHTLSASQISHFQQSLYASDLLSVCTLGLSKVSVLLLLVQITPIESHLRLAFGVGIFVLLWALSAFLVVAFECHLPHAWQFIDNQCVNRAAFWTSFGILNILTDLMLILLPTFMFFRLHVRWHRKAIIIACFASRLAVIVVAICQIVYSRHIYNSTNPTSDIWKAALCGQMVLNLSIVTCCVPYLKPFYLGLESGLMQSNDPLRTNSRKFMSAYSYSDAYAYAYLGHKPDRIGGEPSINNGMNATPERERTVSPANDSVIELNDLSGYLDEGHAQHD